MPARLARLALGSLLVSMACARVLCGVARAAEPPAPGLNWLRLEGAEGCLSAAQLAQSVEARVGRVLFTSASAAALFVDGSVRFVAPDGWRVELAISDPEGRVLGRRTVQLAGADCHVIDAAVSLVIAVTLNPNSGLPDAGIPLEPGTLASLDALFHGEPTELDPASLPPPVAQATGSQTTEPASATKPLVDRPDTQPAPATQAEQHGWRFAFDATGASSLGQVPGAGFGVAGHIGLNSPELWPIELGFLGLFPTTRDADDGTRGRARFGLLLGSLAACPAQAGGSVQLRLCLGAELGRLHVETTGFAVDGPAVNDFVANALATVVLRVPLGRVPYVRVGVIGLLPLIQRAYTYEAADARSAQAFRMPQGAGRAEIGLGAAF